MSNKIITIIAILFIAINGLFAQQETVGFAFNQQYRHLDSLKTTSNIWSMNYRKRLPSNMRIGVALGLDNVKFFENDSDTEPMLKSSNQLFGQLEILQVLYYFYLKGAIQYYTIKGNAYEVTGSYSEIKHHNNYRIFEFPLSAGFTVPAEKFDLFLGINKTFFYGSNKQELIVNNSGTETSLGIESRRTFSTDLTIGVEGALIYHISDDLDLEIGAIKYSDKDFSLNISIWGPLKHMSYMH